MTIAREIIDVGYYISKSGLVKGTWGNISGRTSNTMWITPSGVSYHQLKEEDVAEIDIHSGQKLRGNLKPSSETLLHLEIYRNFHDINGIVHTHSIYASAFAALLQEIPCYTEDQAQIIGGNIPIAKYGPPGSKELADNVVKALEKGVYATLMAHHGIVTVGRTLKEALTVAEIAEKSAELASIVIKIDRTAKTIDEDEILEMRRGYLESYSRGYINNK